MNRNKIMPAVAISALGAMFAMPASAITWTTTSSVVSTSYGNTLSYSSGGVTMTASGYSTTNSGSLQTACLNSYGNYGLGVVNRAEDSNASNGCNTQSPTHTADNQGSVDGLLLSFSQSVQLSAASTGYVSGDSDFSVLYYTGSSAPLLNYSLTSMLSNGWSVLQNVNGGNSSASYNLTNPSTFASYWYVSAYSPSFGGQLDIGDDYFKIRSISANTAVPEPGTLALLGMGLLGLAAARKKQRKA